MHRLFRSQEPVNIILEVVRVSLLIFALSQPRGHCLLMFFATMN